MTRRFSRAALATAIAAFTTIALLPSAGARELWPDPTPAAQARLDAYDKHEQELLQRLKPQMEAWAAKGKPYIPWASKPDDLPQAPIPAFPGAEGGGAHSFGGRGGRVYVVTSLDDAGPGTLREACEAAGPRTVVFGVAGIIRLKMPIFIEAPYITIAGQTAPGDGVCIAGHGFVDNAHDVVIRYIRLRKGDSDIYYRHGVHYGNPVGNIVLDHVSASWGNDQNLDTYRHMYQPPDGSPAQKLPSVNVTIQWCITSEALNTWNHGFGGDWGGRNTGFHHNLLASNTGRNPSIAMSYDFNFVNNVLFNWRHRTVDGGDAGSALNVINNYYKPGPATPADATVRYRVVQPNQSWSKADPVSRWGKVYAGGNVVEGNQRVTADNWDGGVQFNLAPDQIPPGALTRNVTDPAKAREIIAKLRADQPLPMPAMTIQSARDAYESVLAHAGATLPKRDPVDARVVESVRTGVTWGMGQETPIEPMKGLAKNNIGTAGNGIITDIAQVGGYPEYRGEPVKYTQNDGIPDWWKQKYHLDVNDPDLATKDCNGDGYTNVEKYLNGIDPTRRVDFRDPKNNVDLLTADALRPTTAAGDADREAAYARSIAKRSADIIAALALPAGPTADAVHERLMAHYRDLRAWHDAHDAALKSATPAQTADARANLKAVHDQFLSDLSQHLTPNQVEAVKDKMTYGKVKVTYDAYCEIVPNLTEAEKAQILLLLRDAREEAMDAGSAEEKSAVFKRYKGKINNYLNAQGHDVAQSYKDWGARRAAATGG